MPQLANYAAFDGLHWETGSVRNALDYAGARAPHTGLPYSEALLMGVSGGAVMGYFSFAYEGYDPHAVILTRNTFDPMDTMLARLGVVQTVRQTARAPIKASPILSIRWPTARPPSSGQTCTRSPTTRCRPKAACGR